MSRRRWWVLFFLALLAGGAGLMLQDRELGGAGRDGLLPGTVRTWVEAWQAGPSAQAPLPQLSGFELSGLTVRLGRDATGRWHAGAWPLGRSPEDGPEAADEQDGALLSWLRSGRLSGPLHIADARVFLEDAASGLSTELRVSELVLDWPPGEAWGRVRATGTLQVSGRGLAQGLAALDWPVAAEQAGPPMLRLDWQLDTGLALDRIMQSQGVAVRALRLQLGGALGDVSLEAWRLTLEQAHWHTAQDVRLAGLSLELAVRQAQQALMARLALDLAQLASQREADGAQRWRVPELGVALELAHPAWLPQAFSLTARGGLALDGSQGVVQGEFSGRFDDSGFRLQLAHDARQAHRLQLDMQVDRLSLDRYLPPSPGASGDTPAPAPAASEAPPLWLQWQDWPVAGRMSVEALSVQGLTARSVVFRINRD